VGVNGTGWFVVGAVLGAALAAAVLYAAVVRHFYRP
jgi:hypothetical protein